MLDEKMSSALVAAIAERTPYYLLDVAAIARAGQTMTDAWSSQFPNACVAFSYKTCPLSAISSLLRQRGLGAEVASGAELDAAIADGHDASNIVLDGPAKHVEDLRAAVELGVRVQVDSLSELDALLDISAASSRPPLVSLRLASKRDKATWSRFGLLPDEVNLAERSLEAHQMSISGVHLHGGRPSSSAEQYLAQLRAWSWLIQRLHAKARERLSEPFVLNVGGGFPASSSMRLGDPLPHPFRFAAAVGQEVDRMNIPREDIRVIVEPGRCLTEDHGVLIASVIAIKRRSPGSIVVLDAGTNLVRSIQSWRHPVRFLRGGRTAYDIYGAMCFERDLFGMAVRGPSDLGLGERVVVGAAGGYDIPSANVWIHPHPPVLGILGERVGVLRPRGTAIRT